MDHYIGNVGLDRLSGDLRVVVPWQRAAFLAQKASGLNVRRIGHFLRPSHNEPDGQHPQRVYSADHLALSGSHFCYWDKN